MSLNSLRSAGSVFLHVLRSGVRAGVYVSQLLSGGGQVFRELGETEVGAVHHVCLTATLGRTHWLTVTVIAQTPVFSTYTHTHTHTHH